MVFTSCPTEMDISHGSLLLTRNEIESNIIGPSDDDLVISVYKVTGKGPSGEVFIQEFSSEDSIIMSGLMAGSWSISVEGFSESRSLITSKQFNVLIISGQETTQNFTPSSLDGFGDVDVTISWPASITSLTRIHGVLTQENEVKRSFDLQISDSTETGSTKSISTRVSNLSTGLYELTLTFHDVNGVSLVDPHHESVEIYKGMTSTGTCAVPLLTASFRDGSFTQTKTLLSGFPYGQLPIRVVDGSSFLGWYTKPNGGGEKVTPSTLVSDTSDHILYAHSTLNSYNIFFNSHGATSSSLTPLNRTYEDAYGLLPVIEREGYTFDGWFTQTAGLGTQVISTSTVETPKNHTLHASWIKDSYTLCFLPPTILLVEVLLLIWSHSILSTLLI